MRERLNFARGGGFYICSIRQRHMSVVILRMEKLSELLGGSTEFE